jgi:hypothetical protein
MSKNWFKTPEQKEQIWGVIQQHCASQLLLAASSSNKKLDLIKDHAQYIEKYIKQLERAQVADALAKV